jgi:membrane-associated phospholipid phosphatase
MKSKAQQNPMPHVEHTGARHRLREIKAEIRNAEVPAAQEVQRGRRFIRLYAGSLALAGGAFGALLVLARMPGPLLRLDLPVERSLQGAGSPIIAWVLTRVSDLGYSPLNMIAYAVLFAALFAVRLRLEAVLAVGSSLLAGLIGSLLRQAVGRARPTEDLVRVARHVSGFGFPSGHVIQYTTLFGFAFYVVLVAWRGGVPRGLALAGLALLVALVGPSRVYLGAHWPTDTLGAYLLAGIWLAGTIELHLILKPRLGGWWSALPKGGPGAAQQTNGIPASGDSPRV